MLVLYRAKVGTTLMKDRISGRLTGTQGQINPPGRRLERNSSRGEEVVLPLTLHDLPRASSRINDNYCVTKLQTRLLAGSTPQTINTWLKSNVKLPVASHVHTSPGHSQKRELSPGSAGCHCKSYKNEIKVCEKCFLCHSIVLCPTCNNCQKCCTKSACRGQTSKLLANLAGSGSRCKVVQILKEGYTLPFRIRPRLTRSPMVISCYVNPHRNSYLLEALHQLIAKNARTSKTPNISGVFQPTIFSPKTQQQVETYTRFEQIESFPQDGEIQDGDTGSHQNVSPTRGVGYLNRFQRRLLPYTNTGTVQEISEISCPRSDIPIQSTALWSVHSTLGVH